MNSSGTTFYLTSLAAENSRFPSKTKAINQPASKPITSQHWADSFIPNHPEDHETGTLRLKMNLIQKIILGHHLTKMTNIFEAVIHSKIGSFAGAGGGFDSLPPHQMKKYLSELKIRSEKLRCYPKHVVTQELLKNARISVQLNRSTRMEAQQRLLDFLIGEDIAMDLKLFQQSFSR